MFVEVDGSHSPPAGLDKSDPSRKGTSCLRVKNSQMVLWKAIQRLTEKDS
jgi:hypothetical protein